MIRPMLPELSGVDWLEKLRANPKTEHLPVIMLTARGSETDRVKGLNAGADDYIVKPFMPRELIARIQAVLRRYQFQSQAGEENQNVEVVCGPLTMNEASFEAKVDGEPLSLSAKEFKLLLVFAKNPERVYSRKNSNCCWFLLKIPNVSTAVKCFCRLFGTMLTLMNERWMFIC